MPGRPAWSPRNQGAFSFSEPCRECQGVGTVVDEKCPECRGTGGVTKTRTLNVRIPAGVADGQRIRLAGRGEPGERGGPAGDLYVLVRVRADDLFGRSGDDLTLTVPITVPGGGARHRPAGARRWTATVTLRVPPGTPSGRVLRVRGKGVSKRDGQVGDLLVTIEVAVPDGAVRRGAQGAGEVRRAHARRGAARRIEAEVTVA